MFCEWNVLSFDLSAFLLFSTTLPTSPSDAFLLHSNIFWPHLLMIHRYSSRPHSLQRHSNWPLLFALQNSFTTYHELRAVQWFPDDLVAPTLAYHFPTHHGSRNSNANTRERVNSGTAMVIGTNMPNRATSTCRDACAVSPRSAFATTWWIP